MRFRAFISVDIDASLSLRHLCDELRGSRAHLKVVNPDIIHITLKFMGDIEEGGVPDVIDVMRSSAEGVAPFEFKIKGMGAFPSRNRIKVVWVGIPDPGHMVTIAERLDRGLSSIGFQREKRRFTPHLTVARVRSLKDVDVVQEIIERWENHDFGSQQVNSIWLKKSVLAPNGPTYYIVEEIPLL